MKYALAAKFTLPLQFQTGWTVWGMTAAQRILLVSLAEDERKRDDTRRKSPRKRKPAPPKSIKELEKLTNGRKSSRAAR